MPPSTTEPPVHAVIFDINVYMDVCRLLGPGFVWDDVVAKVAQYKNQPGTHRNPEVNSLRAIAICTSGTFCDGVPLHVWFSDLMEATLLVKLTQPVKGPTKEKSGLGWSREDAEQVLRELVKPLLEVTEGAYTEHTTVEGHPPLEHEDAQVWTAARYAGHEDELPPRRWMVTNDVRVCQADRATLPGVVRIDPAGFWTIVHKRRALDFRAKMAPKHPGSTTPAP